MGTAHDAEYFRQRRRQRGIPVREDAYMYSATAVARGKELAMMEQLPVREWPRNLFDRNMTIEELMASGDVADSPVPKIGRTPDLLKCDNPICPQRHNYAVSRVTGAANHRHIHWYCTMRCRNMHQPPGT